MDGLGAYDYAIPQVCFAVYAAVASLSWPRHRGFALVLTLWYGCSYALCRSGFFLRVYEWSAADVIGLPVFLSASLGPAVALVKCWRRCGVFRRFVDGIPVSHLVALQASRIAGSVHLALYYWDQTPGHMGVVNGLLGTAIGATALPLALEVSKHRFGGNNRSLLVVWNTMGLVDLLSAHVFVLASFLGVHPSSPPPTRVGFYPLAMLFLFLAPLALCSHLLLLRQTYFAWGWDAVLGAGVEDEDEDEDGDGDGDGDGAETGEWIFDGGGEAQGARD